MRVTFALAALLALSACGDGSGSGNSFAPAEPVKGSAPPAGQQWSDVVEQTAEGFRMGNPNAPIKLVEYGSRTCPTCGAFGREGQAPLVEKYVSTGKVSFEFRDFLIHGPPDMAAAVLGRCAGAAPFFPILEQMYVNQMGYLEKQGAAAQDTAFLNSLQGKSPSTVTTAWAEKMGLIDFVKQRGIPEPQARACLNDTKTLEAMAKTTNDIGASGKVTGTPTFFINDRVVENVLSWSQLEPKLKEAGA